MSIINKIIDPAVLKDSYLNGSPFPHIVIDNFLNIELCEKLARDFPNHSADFWLKYNNPLEKKLLYNHIDKNMPESIRDVLHYLNADHAINFLEKLTGINNLHSDPFLHGGGMHCTKKGGKLDIHLDYCLHPTLNMERRINLIIYLNKDWEKSYGGNLELWSQGIDSCVQSIEPIFNRAVIFDTGDSSFHGHPEPLNCPDNISRKSLALYYLTEPRMGASTRYKAKFVARPQDSRDELIESFRQKRSGIAYCKDLYEKHEIDDEK
jgi:Rps23 Pro-64 3,4-dihydroxylase Tpa1-like proline 4-hydroxylase